MNLPTRAGQLPVVGDVAGAGASGVRYTATVTILAFTATFARDPDRRADAHKTLSLLLRRQPEPPKK